MTDIADDNALIAERREKLAAAARAGQPAFPNDFKPTPPRGRPAAAPRPTCRTRSSSRRRSRSSVAGRMMLKRVMGKASFAHAAGRLVRQDRRSHPAARRADAVGDEAYAAFKHWDLGDIVGCEGTLFRTKTGELSVKATSMRLLTKSLRPLPDKFHGMADQEQKYRQRYVDLITDEHARARFVARSKACRRSATSWSSTASSRSRRRCCTRSPAAPTPSRSSRTTTRSTSRCSCASRPSCT